MIRELNDAMEKDDALTKIFYNLFMSMKYNRESNNITNS